MTSFGYNIKQPQNLPTNEMDEDVLMKPEYAKVIEIEMETFLSFFCVKQSTVIKRLF